MWEYGDGSTVAGIVEISLEFPQLKSLPYNPAVPLLNIHMKECESAYISDPAYLWLCQCGIDKLTTDSRQLMKLAKVPINWWMNKEYEGYGA
jgi:hypothetical protein